MTITQESNALYQYLTIDGFPDWLQSVGIGGVEPNQFIAVYTAKKKHPKIPDTWNGVPDKWETFVES